MVSDLQKVSGSAIPSITEITSASQDWSDDSSQLPAGSIECQYDYNFSSYSGDSGQLEIDIIPDPDGSNYLQMADAMIQNDQGDTPAPGQPSPPIGQQSIVDSGDDEVLANMTNDYSLEVTDLYPGQDYGQLVVFGLSDVIQPLAHVVSGILNGN
jgi:hypothetical protein